MSDEKSYTINRLLERYRAIDPRYGEHEHQKRFMANYEERQRRAPCPQDHEHNDACYELHDEKGRAACDGSFRSFGL